ncbi:hypothetical protein BGX30_015171 [Mortierella sp. GBA39]|nr:hypothetical protein BGX30_015171 [Mortierella sp. GBA39]
MAIPRRLDPLPHLQGLMLPQVDHDSTVQDVKEIVALPYLGVAGVAELGSNSLVHDGLAGIVVTCCPYLKEVAFGLFTSATPSSFPYELMSAIQEQEVEKPVWSSSFRPIQGPEALGMFLRHSGTLREIALGMYCFVGNDVLSSILETCEALEHLSVQRGHDGSTLARTPISSVDLDGSELWLWDVSGDNDRDLTKPGASTLQDS